MFRPISHSTVETIVRDVLRRQGSLADDPARKVEMVFDSDLALALKQEMVDVGASSGSALTSTATAGTSTAA